MRFGKIGNYWNQTETFEALQIYIDMNFEGLKDDVLSEIAGNAGYSYLDGVTVYDNYYTGSGKKSGSESTSWKPYQSKAKKVSSITFGNCSKLSSKYWTYSNKHKRLILKNNKEA